MDNNSTIPPENNVNQQSDEVQKLQEEMQNDTTDETEIYEPEEEALGRDKKTIYYVGAGLVAVVGYVLYTIFHVPEEPKNLNPAQLSGAAKITSKSGEEVPTLDMGADPSLLPSPPAITLQAPPPPIDSPVYTPPPIVAPPPVSLGTALPPPPQLGGTSTTSPTGMTISDSAPPPPPPPSLASIKNSRSGIGGGDEGQKKRIKTNMLLMDGGGPQDNTPKLQQSGVSMDSNGRFAQSAASTPPTERVTATIVNNLNMTIVQGKIINAVLETAINTDLPGTLRAIVARDTYAEAGRDVLIPKGSRLIGTYNTEVKSGQSRVMIIWQRLIRPDGVDIQIGSPAVDSLGRAGSEGDVDNKYAEIFTASILTSVVTLGAAVGADALLPQQSDSTTTTTPEGNQITNATPAQQSAASAVNNLAGHGKDVVEKLMNQNPTITIDQGTLISVFVNKDLTFPSNVTGSELFVQ